MKKHDEMKWKRSLATGEIKIDIQTLSTYTAVPIPSNLTWASLMYDQSKRRKARGKRNQKSLLTIVHLLCNVVRINRLNEDYFGDVDEVQNLVSWRLINTVTWYDVKMHVRLLACPITVDTGTSSYQRFYETINYKKQPRSCFGSWVAQE